MNRTKPGYIKFLLKLSPPKFIFLARHGFDTISSKSLTMSDLNGSPSSITLPACHGQLVSMVRYSLLLCCAHPNLLIPSVPCSFNVVVCIEGGDGGSVFRNNMKRNVSNGCSKPGYILVLTLIVLGLGMAIATRMFYQASAYLPLASLVAKREQAKTLALGGVQLAISILAGPQEVEKNDPNVTGGFAVAREVKSKAVQFLERVLPSINRWESFNLTEEADGVDGKVAFCITCEDGKINLNNMYDFKKHAFKGSLTEKSKYNKSEVAEQVLQKLFLEIEKVTKGAVSGAAALRAVINFLKERKYQLLDVTELLQIPELSYFKDHVFYQPPLGDLAEGESRPLYLTDLFTTWTNTSHLREGVTLLLQPWLLSDSILAILRFPRAQANDIMKRKQSVQEWVKNFNPSWTVAFKQYGSFSVPNEITDLFASRFEPKVFGVLARGMVGDVGQSVYAIVRADDDSKDQVKFTIDKLYWV